MLLWLGRPAAAIEALEQAQRLDPDLDVVDRFALALAYYLEGRYEAAAEHTALNLRQIAGASSSRVLLAAAYAQMNRSAEAAEVVRAIRVRLGDIALEILTEPFRPFRPPEQVQLPVAE
ncbi:MAG TPA: hypothetical protein VF203_06370 [Burkholderiales bacterium]